MIILAKRLVVNLLAAYGWRIIRIKTPLTVKPINILPLLIRECVENLDDCPFAFIQVGASDGKRFDPIFEVVHTIPHKRGILVEPNPAAYDQLVKNYDGVSGLSFERAAIAEKSGQVQLYLFDHLGDNIAAGTLDAKQAKFFSGGTGVEAISVKALTLNDLFQLYDISRLDLLVIDAEKYDGRILAQLHETKVRPTLIQFEHVHMSMAEYESICNMLSKDGYLLLQVGPDTIARRGAIDLELSA